MTTRTIHTIRAGLWRLIRWTIADAGMGALCAGLFGMIYGGLDALVHADLSRVVLTAGYFSIAGAIAGAVLGSYWVLLEGMEAPRSETQTTNAVFWGKFDQGLLVKVTREETPEFPRSTAVASSPIARSEYFDNSADNEAAMLSNSRRLPTNGTPPTLNGSRQFVNGSRMTSGSAQATAPRRPRQRIRWIGEQEADE